MSPLHPDILAALVHPRHADVVEVTPDGFYCHRDYLSAAGFLAAEAQLLEQGDVLLFDFNLHGPADRWRNVHDGNCFRVDYEGAPAPSDRLVFHVDHHYAIPDLNRMSTTPLVRRWLLGLHEGGRHDVLGRVQGAQYLANHEDQDIAFSLHLAQHAADRAYLQDVGGILAQAALVNDHVLECHDDRILDAFFGGLAIEQMVKAQRLGTPSPPYGTARFSEALTRWIPALGRWLGNRDTSGDAGVVAEFARRERAFLEEKVARFGQWEREGLLHEEEGILWMQPPETTENAYFYRYIRRTRPRRGSLLLLCNPSGKNVKYKIRALKDLPLLPLFDELNEKISPRFGMTFGGRHSAGGSRPAVPPCTEAILEILKAFLRRNASS